MDDLDSIIEKRRQALGEEMAEYEKTTGAEDKLYKLLSALVTIQDEALDRYQKTGEVPDDKTMDRPDFVRDVLRTNEQRWLDAANVLAEIVRRLHTQPRS